VFLCVEEGTREGGEEMGVSEGRGFERAEGSEKIKRERERGERKRGPRALG